ncbi:MAG: radical SAM protein [Methanoregulaceae archaeon]|nr:radical SAM protein [Methanoregulaceae archaeon]
MLLKKTRSLCPVCNRVVEAEITEDAGKVWLERACPEHGSFRDLYWADAGMYSRFERFESIGRGVENPQSSKPPECCPTGCGLCANHRSGTLLANIDLTNRCNLDCDFCFANARACGFVYEPDFDQVVGMLQVLRDEKPVPAPAVQFSGGEPTLREDLPLIIRKAKEMGFQQVQIATNGIKLSKDPAYAMRLKAEGLSTVYLHFDGVTRETNSKLAIDERAIENCDKAGIGVVLVPTMIKGRNDDQIGNIIRFAADHISVIRGINFQPIAFTGAASADDVRRERITIPEIVEDIETQTSGAIKKDDFYPVPCVVPFSDLIEAYTGKPQIRFTAHQHCGAATYVFVAKDGLVPINRLVDVEGFFAALERTAEQMRQGGKVRKYLALIRGIREMRATIHKDRPEGVDLWKILGKTILRHDFASLRDFHWNSLFIGTMHFMDRYNYDLARVQRCCIHYATPDMTLIPFCTYNSGPVFRESIWKKYSKGPAASPEPEK